MPVLKMYVSSNRKSNKKSVELNSKLEKIMGTEIQGKVTPGLLGLKSIIYQG
jgi:chromatin remodeling complex protein RSC6